MAVDETQKKSTIREYYEALLIAVIFVNFARIFAFQAFKIPTGSMEDNLKVGDHIDKAEISRKKLYDKSRFVRKLEEMEIPEKYSTTIMQDLPDKFEYYNLKNSVAKVLDDMSISAARRMALEEVTWLADSFYDVQFKHDSDITERVLFPVSDSEICTVTVGGHST